MDFTADVIIDRPLDEVAALLADPDHAKHWHHDLVSIERTGGEPGAVGSTAVLSYDNKGRKFRLEETIVENDLPRRTVATYETTGIEHRLTTRLEAVDEGSTRVTVENDLKLSGVAKLGGGLLGKTLRKQVEKRVLHLKEWAETGSVTVD